LEEYLVWLLDGDLERDKLLLLLLCTLSISVLAARLHWRMGRLSGRGGARTWVGRLWTECLQLFFCTGIPLGVIWRGALVREMGFPTTLVGPAGLPSSDGVAWSQVTRLLAWLELADAQGLVQLGTGLAVGLGALAVLVVVWLWYARTVLGPVGLASAVPSAVPGWDALRQAVLAQFLWAFYRGFALSVVPDRTLAALLALALISIPWAVYPQHWHDLFSTRGHLVVRRWLLALFTVVVSLTINQLWFLILVHTLWVWVSDRLLAYLSERAAHEAELTPAT